MSRNRRGAIEARRGASCAFVVQRDRSRARKVEERRGGLDNAVSGLGMSGKDGSLLREIERWEVVEVETR